MYKIIIIKKKEKNGLEIKNIKVKREIYAGFFLLHYDYLYID